MGEEEITDRFPALTHLRKYRRVLSILAIVVSITLIVFSIQGFSAWRTEQAVNASCKNLLEIGVRLPSSGYGTGQSLETPEVFKKVFSAYDAINNSPKSGKANEYFYRAVMTFENSLQNNNSSNYLETPYGIYKTMLLPICTGVWPKDFE